MLSIYNFYNNCVLKKEDEEPGTVSKVVMGTPPVAISRELMV